jgi:hypothetical protein
VIYFDVAKSLSEALGKPIVYEALSETEAVKEQIGVGCQNPSNSRK